ncbi:Bax inhibitor-1/YccA family protein [Naumannella cuiyingiana]|uniref:Putative YccA/Bax inhibitor family protein n=1 Tax=Naumannella cuiyingiana TaxID=1347891 RepID=A0A7Z0DA85_9ACTN|nr:Bax inhibitor-1/YccA family protein [Naumannella cuiyingiana]NYI71816.1 putative YccA/Bax inhibitor family protein [Naumannella cuiyingiana]
MMRSSNPVLSRSDAWSSGGYAPADSQYGQQFGGQPQQSPRSGGVMTLDDVITKTGVMLGIVILTAAASFMLLPVSLGLPVAIVAALGTFIITIVVAARRTVPVPLAILFAVLEGAFVGLFSRIFENIYPGIVVQAVFATLVAAVVTLAAYKFFNIKVGQTFRKVVVIATIAFAAVMLINFLFVLFGGGVGLRGGLTGPPTLLAVGISLIAVVLAVLNLVLDFDHVERGIAMRAPADQSWKAAFGLTVTLVWLYVEMLRLISYLRR